MMRNNMAKKNKDGDISTENEENTKKSKKVKSIFDGMDELNPWGSTLSESALSIVDEWIDTGSYALNAIVSGSCYKGIQCGRVIGFAGPSGCGKTLMCMKIIANHLKKDPSNIAVVFDSEIAVDAQTARNLGADPSRIKHYPVNTVNNTRNQVLKLLNNIIDAGLQKKVMIVVESLGNLAGGKEVADAEKGKDAADMGLRAKDIKGFLRVITIPAAVAKTTVLFTNHTYSDPANMYPSAIENQSGGEGPIYLASLIVQLGFKREKNENDFEDEKIIAVAKKVGGITMHALTTKNRFIPHMLTTDLYLNFKTGLDRYSGLFEIAKSLNIFEGGTKYLCGGKELGFRKEFERNPDAWENIILPVLEPIIQKEFTFHSEADTLAHELKNLKKEEQIESAVEIT
jgi:RecA/RadA recombinase